MPNPRAQSKNSLVVWRMVASKCQVSSIGFKVISILTVLVQLCYTTHTFCHLRGFTRYLLPYDTHTSLHDTGEDPPAAAAGASSGAQATCMRLAGSLPVGAYYSVVPAAGG